VKEKKGRSSPPAGLEGGSRSSEQPGEWRGRKNPNNIRHHKKIIGKFAKDFGASDNWDCNRAGEDESWRKGSKGTKGDSINCHRSGKGPLALNKRSRQRECQSIIGEKRLACRALNPRCLRNHWRVIGDMQWGGLGVHQSWRKRPTV